MTSVPPGLRTRTISSTYAFLSGMCSPDSHAHTKSKLLSCFVVGGGEGMDGQKRISLLGHTHFLFIIRPALQHPPAPNRSSHVPEMSS